MENTNLREFINRRPFQPIRIILRDGQSFAIKHPELLVFRGNEVSLCLPRDEKGPAGDRQVEFQESQISRIELLRPERHTHC